jgi:hypothetical protein
VSVMDARRQMRAPRATVGRPTPIGALAATLERRGGAGAVAAGELAHGAEVQVYDVVEFRFNV